MPGALRGAASDALLEYSVVFTDRALNHMSDAFQEVMRDISTTLRSVYGADQTVVVPGSGTYGMEAVARQFATDRRCLVLRNGWFGYRWTQIFETCRIPAEETVLRARPLTPGPEAPYVPAPLEEVVDTIRRTRPEVVFAAHVETASGLLLPEAYLTGVGRAAREVGALFVLDGIASGAAWVDMRALSVDVLLSAPQKGWSGPAGAAFVLLGARAAERLEATESTSFACDLRRWRQIMAAYEGGTHAYHATMPTDALRAARDAMRETVDMGLAETRKRQLELGLRVRASLERRGFASVAADGYRAPGVVVSYTADPEIRSGRALAALGVQIASGVPLRCGEPDDFSTFRIGLFGLDKLRDVDATVGRLDQAFDTLARRGAA